MKIRNKKIIELAEEAGVDEYTIKKTRDSASIESCRLNSLFNIAAALSVDLDDLFEIINIKVETNVQK
jgi:DNA-binding Xre family transcriptional regulator